MEDEEYQYKQQLYKEYVDQRNEANRFALEIGARYEKLLSLVAGGALVVSLTFIEKIAPHPAEYTKWVILCSWIFLGLGIISTLIAIYESQNALQKKVENLDTEITQKLNPDDSELQEIDSTSNPHSNKVIIANRVSLYSSLLGLFLLIIFAFLNFPQTETKESNDRQIKPETTTATSQGTEDQGGKLHSHSEPSSTTSKTEKIKIENARRTEKEGSPEADARDEGILHSDSESGESTEATGEERGE